MTKKFLLYLLITETTEYINTVLISIQQRKNEQNI